MRYAGEFQVVRCQHCTTFYQWPRLPWDELKGYYEGDYDSYTTAIQDDPSWLRQAIRRVYPIKMRRFVERFCRSGRLLDVGCGSGLFLEEMQRVGGWELHGLEPTAGAAAYVRQRFHIPIVEQTFEQAAFAPERFDVVTLWNVLEHVESPVLTIRKVWEALKPGGYFIFAIPNYESLSRWLFGHYWFGWELPRHLFIFPQAALIWLLKREGFQPLTSECFMITYAILGHSLEFWQQDWPPMLRPLSRLLTRMYYSPFGRLGIYPVQVLAERFGLTTVRTWAVRKVEARVGA